MYMFEYLMCIFEDQMCIFGYLKIPDIILSLVSSQKLDWTHTFGTYCTLWEQYGNLLEIVSLFLSPEEHNGLEKVPYLQ